MLDPTNTLQWQARRIEELEAEVAYLRDQLADVIGERRRTALIDTLGLTKQQARVLATLMRQNHAVTWAGLALVMETDSRAPFKLTQVIIRRVRVKLEAAGIPNAIETVYGVGYKLRPAARQAIQTIIDGGEV